MASPLSTALNPAPLPKPPALPSAKALNSLLPVRDKDIATARATIIDVMDTTEEALAELFLIAKQSQHPRAYEVLARFLEIRAKQAHDLLDVHGKDDKLKESERKSAEQNPAESGGNTQINVFIGDTSELLNSIKKLDNQTTRATPFAEVAPIGEKKLIGAPPVIIDATATEVKESNNGTDSNV